MGDRETDWGRRTFRGSSWENEVAEHFEDWNLTCEYKKILVNNVDEHNDAFELLEMWLDNSFKKYKKMSFNFIYERAEKEISEDEEIDIDSIEELHLEKDYQLSSSVDWEMQDKINDILKAVKQLNKKIKEKE